MSSSDVEIMSDDVVVKASSRPQREGRAVSSAYSPRRALTRPHDRMMSGSPQYTKRSRQLGLTDTEVLELSDGSDDDDEVQVTGYQPKAKCTTRE